MLTVFNEKTSSLMGNGPTNGETNPNGEYTDDEYFAKNSSLNRRNNTNGLIFFAGTDKARVITEILEERGWSRTKDHNVTNFTIKWCLAHQVDWNQFQEGKQLVNNIPGQLAFSDKINLWYTIRDYLCKRRTADGNHIQTFLPMTFVLDEENGVADFLRSYKKQARTWICKPRYSYAGRGIYIVSGNSDLNTVLKFKAGTNNRLQYEPRLPGYIMQEYIARPLLIKSRKFDIRVHWLVAWTKPLLVFYNHNASVVRLSLNLYRELDYDRATHLTNLSVQENHCRYAFAQESTGMTMNQLNHYFNQCFRPFHPKMCQDWVMTVMQERMQTIIRHVIRASKDKLTRGAGQFGLFGCDFLLDENFRIWLLEVNDNPGVGWGNTQVNTSTKPLFEETLNIVFECFEKYKNGQSILPIQCLQNYQLIYNEDNDNDRLVRDDNQIFVERLSIKYARRDLSSRASFHRILPRVNTSRTSTRQNENTADNKNTDFVLPGINRNNTDSPATDIRPPSSSTVHTTSQNPSIIDSIAANSSQVDAKPSTPSIVRSTSFNIPQVDTTTLTPSIVRSASVIISKVAEPPLNSITINPTDNTNEVIESLKHDDDIELELFMKPRLLTTTPKPKSLSPILSALNRPIIKINTASVKRTLSTAHTINLQRKKRIGLTPLIIDNRRYTHRHGITPLCTETIKKKDIFSKNKILLNTDKDEKQDDQSSLISSRNIESPSLFSFN